MKKAQNKSLKNNFKPAQLAKNFLPKGDHTLLILVVLSIVGTIISFFLGFVLSLLEAGSCKTRYGFDQNKNISTDIFHITQEINLQGNGRYEALKITEPYNHEEMLTTIQDGKRESIVDKNLYHQWLDTGVYIDKDTNPSISFHITGNISLEQKFYNNLHKIPRVGESSYLQIPFIVGEDLLLFKELNKGDQIIISINKESNSPGITSLEDFTKDKLLEVDCSQELFLDKDGTSHSPDHLSLCGKVIYATSTTKGNHEELLATSGNFYFRTKDGGKIEFIKINPNNSSESEIVILNNQIMLKLDSTTEGGIVPENISEIKITGLETTINKKFSEEKAHGGFVFNIQHSTSIVTPEGKDQDNGAIEYIISNSDPNTDSYDTKDTDQILKKLNSDQSNNIYTMQPSESGNLWLRVHLEEKYKENIENVSGSYNISWSTKKKQEDFITTFFIPTTKKIFDTLENGMQYIRSMVCVTDKDNISDIKSKLECKDLFFLLRTLLTLYVIFYGFSFLLGIVEVNQYDLVIRIIKIACIASIINGNIVYLIENYIIDLILNFSDIILNKIVYNEKDEVLCDESSRECTMYFFTFASNFLTKITNSLFWNQILGLMGSISNSAQIFGSLIGIIMGMVKVFFIILSCALMVLALLETMVVVIASKLFLILLITFAPIFIVCLLFEVTKDFFMQFINWIIFFVFFPIFVVGGMIVIVNIFTVFLEEATSFSICSRCAFTVSVFDFFSFILVLFPFAMPIAIIINIIILGASEIEFLNEMVLFCFPYFQPWGHHYSFKSSNIDFFSELSIGFALFIISMIVKEYGRFISSLVESLFSIDFAIPEHTKNTLNKILRNGHNLYSRIPIKNTLNKILNKGKNLYLRRKNQQTFQELRKKLKKELQNENAQSKTINNIKTPLLKENIKENTNTNNLKSGSEFSNTQNTNSLIEKTSIKENITEAGESSKEGNIIPEQKNPIKETTKTNTLEFELDKENPSEKE